MNENSIQKFPRILEDCNLVPVFSCYAVMIIPMLPLIFLHVQISLTYMCSNFSDF